MKTFEGQHWRQYGIAVVANLAIMSVGYAGSWMSPTQIKLEDVSQSPLPDAIDREEAARIGSALVVGAIIGPFIGGIAASYIGRKWGIMLGSIPLFVGWLLLAAATNVYMIYAGRFSFGLAVGVLFTNIPLYCGEIAVNEVRGALGSILSIALGTGGLIAYTVIPYVSYSGAAYVGVALCSLFTTSMYFMPESPSYYLSKDDRESAQESLSMIRGKTNDGIEEELNKMAVEISAATAEKAKLSDLWATRGNIKALYICCGLLGLQPFTGITAVNLYTENIFRSAGMEMDAPVAAIILEVVAFSGSLITPFVVDRLGRRVLLITSSLGMVVTLSVLGTYFLLDHNENPITSSISFVPLVALAINTVVYSAGFGPVPWAILGELFPMNIKPVAAPIVNTVHWGMSFLVARYFYSVVDNLGMHYAFWIFAGACIVAFLFVFFFVPETKGKSFQEIQDMLNNRKSSIQKLDMEFKHP